MSDQPTTAVLLINLGSPGQPDMPSIRKWLAEFLRDRRVVQLPRLVWWPILYGFILPFRPSRLKHAYAAIWQDEGSPLAVISKKQASALDRGLSQHGMKVLLAMRYGNPSIQSALTEIRNNNIDQVVILPLYPQYSHTTTSSVVDAVEAYQSTQKDPLKTIWIDDYHDQPAYIRALAESVQNFHRQHGTGDRLLMSFHGIPEQYDRQGDPYAGQCRKTAQLLAEELNLEDGKWGMSFQSRLGRAQWLQPYTDEILTQWAAQGVSVVDVICPGFATDCLETLEEINIRGREQFQKAGGTDLRYIPALNDSNGHISMLTDLVLHAQRQHAAEGQRQGA